MKKFLKSAGMPILVFGLAIGGAFATNAMKNSNFFTDEAAYQRLDSEGLHCVRQADCSNIPGPTCTWEESPGVFQELYGMETVDNKTLCTKTLYKIQ